jgi:ribokinase
MKIDVVCFGALNIDKLYKVNRIAKADEECEILDYVESSGGSAANTAVALSRLGVKTGYIGKVAQGLNGQFLLNALNIDGVNTQGIKISPMGRTGMGIGFVDKVGARALYLDPGVNDHLDFNEIDLKYLSDIKFLHLSSFLGKKSFEAQKKVVETISDIKVTLDPGIIYAQKGIKKLRPLLKRCYIVFPNENEIKLMTGRDYKEGSKILLSEGVNIVAVKLGDKGCYITNGRESHLISSYDVKVVDTTGAGDAFCAGFIFGFLKGISLRECGLIGNFVASKCLSKMGSRSGFPKIEELTKINIHF